MNRWGYLRIEMFLCCLGWWSLVGRLLITGEAWALGGVIGLPVVMALRLLILSRDG